jgi:8-oxo-dGTP pyrophosphatase MutT (NUDIX family)
MLQKYAVYLNRKALLFNNSQNVNTDKRKIKTFKGGAKSVIQQGFKWLTEVRDENSCAFFEDLDYYTGIELLKTEFKFIVAAGGVVADEKGNILFIERLGLWDLPKGKVEQEESNETAAVREIMEETGLTLLLQQEFLCSTFHIYWLKNKFILKESVWYSFQSSDNCLLMPQQEENITKAEWINPADIGRVLSNTYPSIIDVIEYYNSRKGINSFYY